MRFKDLATEDPPRGHNLDKEVFILLQQFGALRLSDTLLCQAYHLVYDGWELIHESPNHWIVAIPDNRGDERADASIVRARREVDNKLHEPSMGLDGYLEVSWSEEEYNQWLQSQINLAFSGTYGQEVLEEMQMPTQLREQVAWILTNHPETRGNDKALIKQWMELWGGWQRGGSAGDGDQTRYSIPKNYQWQDVTPESITARRREWHQKGLFLPDEGTQAERQRLASRARAAFRDNQDPWEVLN